MVKIDKKDPKKVKKSSKSDVNKAVEVGEDKGKKVFAPQSNDAPLQMGEDINNKPLVYVARSDLEQVFEDLYVKKGKTKAEARAIAIIAVQNMDIATSPKSPAQLKIEIIRDAVINGDITDFWIVMHTKDGHMGQIGNVTPENRQKMHSSLVLSGQMYANGILYGTGQD